MLSIQRFAIDEMANAGKIPSLQALYRPFGKSGRMFRGYGMVACANGPRPPLDLTVPPLGSPA
jgi:hypothetical protein